MGNKLFGTDGVRGVANTYPITADFAFTLAKVLSRIACNDKKTVAIGKDTRLSGDMLEAALSAGFTASGITVILLGVVPTPLVTLKTPSLGVDMSLMITASHNPYQDNGIKLIDKNGDKFADDFYEKLEELIYQEQQKPYSLNSSSVALGRILKNENIIKDYIADMRKIAKNDNALKGLRIVVDCANGAYSSIFPQTFKDLGAEIVAINNTPDGYNINQNCGSQHTEQLADMVVKTNAHFGIAVDGDGDRIILVDNTGKIVDGDQLLCFLANYLKKHHLLTNNTVISTEWSNSGLADYLKNNGFCYYKSKVGERYVVDLMKEKQSVLGGEIVGHIVLLSYAKSGDALVTAIILSLAYLEDDRDMAQIFPIFIPFPCVIENIRFSTKDFMCQSVEYPEVKQALVTAKNELGADGSLIARKSGTEPVLKLRVEGKDAQVVVHIANRLKKIISTYVR